MSRRGRKSPVWVTTGFATVAIVAAPGRIPEIVSALARSPAPPHAGRGVGYSAPMGGWFWLIALGLFLVLIGLYLHWSVILLGALLPFVPILAELLRRRRQ